MYRYVVNALVRLPAHGKYAAGGRATRHGEVTAAAPMSDADMKHAIACEVARERGCDTDGITFIEFAYTELT